MRLAVVCIATGFSLFSAAARAESEKIIPLPPSVEYPEGITYDAQHNAMFTAGTLSGQLARIDLASDQVQVVGEGLADQIGKVRRGVLGMKLDAKGRLWMAGGATNSLFVIDPQSGKLLHRIGFPGEGGLINDIAIVGDRAFLTDTFRPSLWSVSLNADAVGEVERWVDFTGTPVDGTIPNLNGIAASADGSALVAVHMSSGNLFRIDIASRKVEQIDLKGETVPGGDGLVLAGNRLYVICQPKSEIVTINLGADVRTGTVVLRKHFPLLAAPATAAIGGDYLFVTSTQFNHMEKNTPVRPFTVFKVPLAALEAE